MAVGRRVDYAVRALCYIAGQASSRPVPRTEIETRQSVPSHFLAKVLRQLVTAGLLTSAPGVHGGFRLARAATEISLCDVYESIEGRLCVMECVDEGERFCCFAPVCTQIDIWRGAQEHLRSYLRSVSLAALADQKGLVPRLAATRPVPASP